MTEEGPLGTDTAEILNVGFKESAADPDGKPRTGVKCVLM